jgi:predicted secreted protein
MSNLTQIALIMAIGIPHAVFFVFLDCVRKKRENEIVTGLIGAVPMSRTYRRFSLYTSYFSPAAMQLGFQLVMVIVYVVIIEDVTDIGVKLVAYSVLFFASVGVIGSLMMSGLGYAHLRSVLRQAEAD